MGTQIYLQFIFFEFIFLSRLVIHAAGVDHIHEIIQWNIQFYFLQDVNNVNRAHAQLQLIAITHRLYFQDNLSISSFRKV